MVKGGLASWSSPQSSVQASKDFLLDSLGPVLFLVFILHHLAWDSTPQVLSEEGA
jgi:hypothetical protein